MLIYVLHISLSLNDVNLPPCFHVAACPDGKYGKGCTKTCSPMCIIPGCFANNGSCHSGCKAGFQGRKCNEGNNQFINLLKIMINIID